MKILFDQIKIDKATHQELSEIFTLLDSVDLPIEGVEENLDGFLTARNREGMLIGVIGLESHGKTGLLRSAAVAPDLQRSGLGSRLTEHLLNLAEKAGIEDVLLFTSTAREFFERRFRFVEVDRTEYISELSGSVEWNLPRCSSAILMRREVSNR